MSCGTFGSNPINSSTLVLCWRRKKENRDYVSVFSTVWGSLDGEVWSSMAVSEGVAGQRTAEEGMLLTGEPQYCRTSSCTRKVRQSLNLSNSKLCPFYIDFPNVKFFRNLKTHQPRSSISQDDSESTPAMVQVAAATAPYHDWHIVKPPTLSSPQLASHHSSGTWHWDEAEVMPSHSGEIYFLNFN